MTAAYWLAPALAMLRAEVNALRPDRDRASDGWIGDKRHAGSTSDHNPANWPREWTGVVRALDLDNDLGEGLTGQTLWDHLTPMLGKHPALGAGAYLIYNHRIISTDRLTEGARPYSGANPHTGHIHVSVARAASGYNSTTPWGLTAPTQPNPESEEDDDMAKNFGIYYTEGKTTVYLIGNYGSGAYHKYSNGAGNGPMGGTYNNPLAAAFGTGSYAKVTKGHFNVIEQSLRAISKISGDLAVTLDVAGSDGA